MRLLLALALALVPATAVSAQASTAVTAAQVPEAQLAKARRLATLITPADAMLQQNMVGWEAAISRSLALDPTAAKLEQQYPGVQKAGVDAARDLARQYCSEGITRMLELRAGIMARRLSDSELDELIAFFSSPLGQRFTSGMFANVDTAGLGRDVARQKAETGSAEISEARVASGVNAAARKTAEGLSTADNLALMRFTQTVAAQKLTAAGKEAEPLVMEMVNHPDPKWIENQSRIVTGAMLAFVDSHSRK